MTTKTPLQRIEAFLEHLASRGYNSERVNKIYRKILAQKFNVKSEF